MGEKLFKQPEFLSHLVYLIKCLFGVIICYVLYTQIPQYPFYWAIVSVLLALSPDNSSKQAYIRIEANMLGCTVGLCLYPVHIPELLMLCAGVLIIVSIGIGFKIMDTLRSALAAFIIVSLQQEHAKQWYIALERVICVAAGCLVALLLTMLFNLIFRYNKTLKT